MNTRYNDIDVMNGDFRTIKNSKNPSTLKKIYKSDKFRQTDKKAINLNVFMGEFQKCRGFTADTFTAGTLAPGTKYMKIKIFSELYSKQDNCFMLRAKLF
jgi:hypothetical protein